MSPVTEIQGHPFSPGELAAAGPGVAEVAVQRGAKAEVSATVVIRQVRVALYCVAAGGMISDGEPGFGDLILRQTIVIAPGDGDPLRPHETGSGGLQIVCFQDPALRYGSKRRY